MKNEKKLPFSGACCAIITPFQKDGNIDGECIYALIERQIDNGTHALTVLGTTGEAPTVSDKEHHELLSVSAKAVNGRIPVIGGCGSNDTHHACYLALSAKEAGCDAVLAITPYYNKTNSQGLISHFRMIAESVSIPVILYNVPQRTGVNIPFEVYSELSEIPNIVAVKDASGSFTMASRIISELGDRLYLYSGNDELTLPLMSIGAKGVISVASNLVPSEMSALCTSFLRGNVKLASDIHRKLTPLFRMLSCDVNPIPVKHAASRIGLCEEVYRLPLCSPDEAMRTYIKKVMCELGFNV